MITLIINIKMIYLHMYFLVNVCIFCYTYVCLTFCHLFVLFYLTLRKDMLVLIFTVASTGSTLKPIQWVVLTVNFGVSPLFLRNKKR